MNIKHKLTIGHFTLFCVLIFQFFSLSVIAEVPSIRVRIAKGLSHFYFSGIDLKKKLFAQNISHVSPGKTELLFNCDQVLQQIKNIKLYQPLVSLSSQLGIINWKNAQYRGEMIISPSGRKAGCDLINELGMETYISALLAKEMKSSWPAEALKAQAIAARTYAYQKKIANKEKDINRQSLFFDIENSELHQVNGTFNDETITTFIAAKETQGEVLMAPNKELTPIFFHSKCGGKTLRPEQVWHNKVNGYTNVDCPYCAKHGKQSWSYRIPERQMARIISDLRGGIKYSDITLVQESQFRPEVKFYIKDVLSGVKKSDIRNVLGRDILPSNNFSLTKNNQFVVLGGEGFGHGVGLCQFGAYEMAKQGFTYKQILKHYFPNHKIEKIY